jgi:hypothetical protein
MSFFAAVALLPLAMIGRAADMPTPALGTSDAAIQFAAMQAELCAECGKDMCGQCGAPCDCSCYCDLGCGGFYGGAEAVIVRPHFQNESNSLGLLILEGEGLEQLGPRYDYAATPRAFLGWRNCRGTGVRARYWRFDEEARLGLEFFDENLSSTLDVQTLDLEFTQRVCWGPVESNLAFGVRYGGVENGLEASADGLNLVQTRFDGWGPTMAIEHRVPLGQGGLAVVGNLRGSLLFGDMGYSLFDEVLLAEGRADMTAVAEMQVGLEWQRCTRFGVLSVFALLEGQWWAAATSNLVADALPLVLLEGTNLDMEEALLLAMLSQGYSTSEDLGFIGGTIGIQLAR